MLSLNQRRSLCILAVIGLIFMLIALIHLLLAVISYKRRGAFIQTLFVGFMCLLAGGLFISNDFQRPLYTSE